MKLTSKDFYSTDKCIGCSKCEKLCPLNNITMIEVLRDGKQVKIPKWNERCSHCMACIGNCPTKAIEYGGITMKKEQYNFGKYKHVIQDLEEDK